MERTNGEITSYMSQTPVVPLPVYFINVSAALHTLPLGIFRGKKEHKSAQLFFVLLQHAFTSLFQAAISILIWKIVNRIETHHLYGHYRFMPVSTWLIMFVVPVAIDCVNNWSDMCMFLNIVLNIVCFQLLSRV